MTIPIPSGMRIVAFVKDPVEIKKIMKSQGLPDFRAPPPIPRAPAFDEQEFMDDIPDYDKYDA